MNRSLLVAAFALAFIFSLGFVSADHNHGFGSYWGLNSNSYDKETYRDVTENRHTTLFTSDTRYGSERIKTETTTLIDVYRESKTPTYSLHSPNHYSGYSGYHPRYHGNIFSLSNWRYKEPYNDHNPNHRDSKYSYYYEPRYNHEGRYFNWRW